jgi:D-sedoheptulose 7-phosphate isomerase
MLEGLPSLVSELDTLLTKVQQALAAGHKVLFFGNGGSASDAQHLAAEFVVRYHKNRQPYGAIALTTDTSILTAHSNDFDFSSVFDRQILALAQTGDIVIGLSTSGNSENVMSGIKTAKDMGLWTCAFTGASGGRLKSLADLSICIPSDETARIQEGHILIGHWLCEALDQDIAE